MGDTGHEKGQQQYQYQQQPFYDIVLPLQRQIHTVIHVIFTIMLLHLPRDT